MALPQGPLVKFRDGTLVLDSGSYYIISEGKKRRFIDLDQLQSLGYDSINLIQASLVNYAEGQSIEN